MRATDAGGFGFDFFLFLSLHGCHDKPRHDLIRVRGLFLCWRVLCDQRSIKGYAKINSHSICRVVVQSTSAYPVVEFQQVP